MIGGSRVTDAVDFFKRRGELRGAVKVIRKRHPERFRWRNAVGGLTKSAGKLRGLSRMRIEEPIREMLIEVPDEPLQTEVVLDARRYGVDLDRGEILPARRVGDLRRLAYLTNSDVSKIQRYVHISDDFFAPVDSAAATLVGRSWADVHRRRAQQLWLQLPDPDGPEPMQLHHQILAERARREMDESNRWTAFARAMVQST